MTILRWFPGLAVIALALICLSADRGRAGSFFGPCCYGAPYTEEYPNRSHNVFGAAAGIQCPSRHPIFKHRWFRKHQSAPCDGAAVNALPGYGVPVNATPGHGIPVEAVPAPIMQTPSVAAPAQATAVAPAPAVSTRIAPVAVPLPASPVNAEAPVGNQSSRPPF
jgi:hypothetical protein